MLSGSMGERVASIDEAKLSSGCARSLERMA